jgi:hypothetical protein
MPFLHSGQHALLTLCPSADLYRSSICSHMTGKAGADDARNQDISGSFRRIALCGFSEYCSRAT